MDGIIVAIATIVAICCSTYLFALSQIDHIKKNWIQYRCNPVYMPVAGMVGQDVYTNFTRCIMSSFHSYAGYMLDPIMAEFSVVSDTIEEVGGALHDMRGMMSGVRGGFLSIVGSVFGKIQNTMSSIQYIIVRMRTLMSRIVGIMMSFMLIFYTGMETGQSVVNGPIYKVVSAL
jgi:phage-related protein